MVTYVSLMILLSRVEDRKAVLGLFNTAHEMTHGHSDSSFPRLGQMIIDYESPIKKLAEEFTPHQKLLYQAVMSLRQIFMMRNLPAEEWRKSQILSLVGNPGQMLSPAQTDVIQCEYLSIDTMEKYIICELHRSCSQLADCVRFPLQSASCWSIRVCRRTNRKNCSTRPFSVAGSQRYSVTKCCSHTRTCRTSSTRSRATTNALPT